ncbi:UvrD-helicase domain-containing protein [Candidatus Saccharibacteria bacterium]|nr:UvrD-helicase domain-containing protein [Candidatus Saccharibacteria bacterium]
MIQLNTLDIAFGREYWKWYNGEMDLILEGLNKQQREAVETLEGPVLILAGAGSGKTKTLTHRIANLISHGVSPSRILAVTFTNKAAKEMRERLWGLVAIEPTFSSSRLEFSSTSYAGQPGKTALKGSFLGDVRNIRDENSNQIYDSEKAGSIATEPPRSFMPYMGTFHGIAVRILRIEAEALGLDKNFVIYDMDDQVSLIRRIMKELKLTENKQLKPKSVQAVISSEKNKGNGPEEYEACAFYPNQKQIAKIFYKYEEEKSKAQALDFDDLLLKELELFKNHPEVRKKWQEKFEHILIDEYQDTNIIQYNIVKLLVNEKQNICAVGDDWQSIYSWRGADFTNILHFERDFPGAKVIKLEQNYRSTGNILEASQKVINENKTRTDKTLFTEAGMGEPIDIESLRDETAEANFVALKIINMQKDYPDFSDFAVLYRTNAQSYAFEKAFIDMHIPYKIVGGVRFYDRKEVKDVLAILKLIVNQRDKVSLARVVGNVLSGVGEASLAKILAAMDAIDGPEPLLDADLPEVLKAGKAKNGLMRLTNFLRKYRNETNVLQNYLNVGEIVKSAVEYFDFKSLTDDGTPTAEDRMGNLEVLAATASEYVSLDDFLADASLMSSADEASVKNSVTLMTLHAAKGLEFPVVFIVGLEEGLFPNGRCAEEEAELEEERRLMYVGMTRAMRRLFLTYAGSRYAYGSRNFNMPSRFLMELGYNPYGSSGFRDEDGDGFTDFDDFGESDFDPFPEDLPVFE